MAACYTLTVREDIISNANTASSILDICKDLLTRRAGMPLVAALFVSGWSREGVPSDDLHAA